MRGLRRQLPLALVLVVLAVGLATIATDHWRRGCGLVGLSLLIAGMARMLLPRDRIGLLAVRGRALDVCCALLLGGAVLVLAWIVPSTNSL
jgi:Protein of unknown function (DUF3017)